MKTRNATQPFDLVFAYNSAYSNERVGAIDSRYLHPDERELAAKLAEASDGQFTAEEIPRSISLHHALPSEGGGTDALGKRTGGGIDTLLNWPGFYERSTDFIPTDSKLIEDINNSINKDDDESK